MANYVVTGGASGIGAAVAASLRAQNHQVVSVDLKQADIEADLSHYAGRQQAVAAINSFFPDGIDGFIPCAGLGPNVKPPSLIASVNYFAAVAMTNALMSSLNEHAIIILIGSNSAYWGEPSPDLLAAFAANDEIAAKNNAMQLDGQSVYAASKYALTEWMRVNIGLFAERNIRINAVAPGIIETALTKKVMQDKDLGDAIKEFSQMVPLGKVGQVDDIANFVSFLVSEQASYFMGSIITIDGGSDALLRPTIKL